MTREVQPSAGEGPREVRRVWNGPRKRLVKEDSGSEGDSDGPCPEAPLRMVALDGEH